MKNKQKIIKILSKLDQEDWDVLGDGHIIMKPTYYTDLGFPATLVKSVTEVQTSDGTLNGSIWKDQFKAIETLRKIREYNKEDILPDELIYEFESNYVPSVEAVWNLHFLYAIARLLDIKYQTYIGSGFQAREIRNQLQAICKTGVNNNG